MDKKFDKDISHKLQTIENSPIPYLHINKDEIWSRVEATSPAVTPPLRLKWIYLAAASLFIGLFFTSVTVYRKNQKISSMALQISTMKRELMALQYSKHKIEKVFVTQVDTVKIRETDTVFSTHMVVVDKPVFKYDTVYISKVPEDSVRLLALQQNTKVSVSSIQCILNETSQGEDIDMYSMQITKDKRKLRNPNEGFNPDMPKRSASKILK